MSLDITTIGIALDTSGLEKGARALGDAEKAANRAADASDKVSKAATSAASSYDAVKVAVSKFTAEESRHVQKLVDEYKQLGMNRSQMEAYKAAQSGMSKGAQEIVAAVSAKIDAYKREHAELEKSSQGLSNLASTGRQVAGVLASIGVGLSVGGFLKLADASTNVASKLGLVTSSAADLVAVQQKLFTVAQNSRVSFVDLVGTYSQLARATKELGISQDSLLGVVKTVSQAVTISGGSAESARAALTQLSQGFASGALRGDELNSVLEQTPRLAQAIADGLGVSIGKLRQLGAAGELTAEKVLGALEKTAGSVAVEFGKMALTVEQASTQAANSALKLVGALDRITGASTATAGGIARLSTGMDGLTLNIERLASSKGLSNFFFLAFNNERSLNGELEITQKELAGLEARLAKAPSNIYTRSAVFEMREYVKELKEAQARLAALSGQAGPTDPRDQTGYASRGQSYANEAKRQATLAEDLNKFRLNLAGVPAGYIKEMTELIRLNQAGVLVGKEYTDALKQQQAVLLKKTGAVQSSNAAGNQELSTYESLIASIRGKIEADKLELSGGAALTESQRIRIKLDQDLAAGRIKLGSAYQIALRAAIEDLSMSEAEVAAKKTIEKANLSAAASREKYIASLDTGLDKIRADTAAQIEATERLGLSKEAIAELDAAKLDMLATDLELQAIKAMDRNLDEQTYTALKQQAAAYRDLALAKKGFAAKDSALDMQKASVDAAKKAEEEWQKTADSINNSLTDALMRGFESGKGFAKNMRDTVVNMFKTLVLRPIISAVVNPVAGALTGAMGLSGAAQAAGGISTAMSGASFLGNAAGILGGAGTAAGYGASALFAGNGLGALSGGFGMLTGGGGLGMAAQGAGMIAGVLGPIALGVGAVMALVKKFDDSGTMHTGALSQYSAAGGLANSTTHGAFGMGFGGVDYSAETEKFTGAMAQSIVMMLDSTATTFGKEAGYKAATAFADDTSKDGAWGGLLITKLNETIVNWDPSRTSKWAPKEFADGAAGKEQYLAAVAADVRGALESIGLPAWATGMLNKLGQGASIEQLAGVIDQINTAKAMFVRFGQYMPTFAGLADAALGKLVDASGGVGALAGNMSAFVDGFYTDAEKLAVNTQNVTDAMAKLGFEMPKTREEFKELVASQLATAGLQLGSSGEMIRVSQAMNDSAATSAAGLLALSGAVNGVLPAFEEVSGAVTESIKDMTRAMDDYISKNARTTTEADRIRGLAAVGNTAALAGMGVPGFAAGGSHAGGVRLVGENGPELEVTGPSRIYSAAQTRGMLSGEKNTARLEALVEKLTDEVVLLRAEVRADVGHNAQTAKILRRITPDGDAMATREAVAL